MDCDLLSQLPEGQLEGFIAKTSQGHIFYWKKLLQGQEEEIKKRLERINQSRVLEFSGTKQELREKIRELNQVEGVPK